MDWGGKLVGGALGLLVAGPVGAALGVLAGHLVDDRLGQRGSRGSSSARRSPPGAPSGVEGRREDPPRASFYQVEDADPFTLQEDESAELVDPEAVAADFFRITFEVMGHVAKSDGRVSEQEIRAARIVMDELGLDPTQVKAAIGHFNRGKQADYDLTQVVLGLRRVCVGRPDLLRTFLEIEMRTAIAGSDLRGPARPMLLRIAALIGVSGLEFARLETVLRIRHRARGNRGGAADWNRPGERASREYAREQEARRQQRHRSPPPPARMSLAEAYEVLGVGAAAGDPEVTKAYRRQLSRHHPDKLKANGLPESMLGHAKQRTQQIIEAWEVIREQRNL